MFQYTLANKRQQNKVVSKWITMHEWVNFNNRKKKKMMELRRKIEDHLPGHFKTT